MFNKANKYEGQFKGKNSEYEQLLKNYGKLEKKLADEKE
jgi:hypothetical protein